MGKIKHVVDPKTKVWYHLDEWYNVFTCDCMSPPDRKVSLCLTICDHLKDKGDLREVKSQIAKKRKELGLLYGDKDDET